MLATTATIFSPRCIQQSDYFASFSNSLIILIAFVAIMG